MSNSEYLPVVDDVSTFPETVEVEMMNPEQNILQSLETFSSYIDLIEKNIVISEKRCEDAELFAREADAYKPKWYKIGSSSKKANLMSKAQHQMALAICSLQEGQTLSFKYQQQLANFCAICFQCAMNNENKLERMSGQLLKFVELHKSDTIPASVRSEINRLYQQIEQQKTFLKQQEALRKQNNSNNKGSSSHIIILLIAIIAGLVWYIMK